MYKEIISPALTHFDSERGHNLAVEALHLAESNPLTLKLVEVIGNGGERFEDPVLNIQIGQTLFDNPVIVGAGETKNGKGVRAFYAAGFGGVEAGTVLYYPQDGNGFLNGKQVMKRLWILGKDHDVSLNWLGLPNKGVERADKQLEKYSLDEIPIGINVSRNAWIEGNAPWAFAAVIGRLYRHASYFSLGFSPNTEDVRKLLDSKDLLMEIALACLVEMDKHGGYKDLYIKIGPDLSYSQIDAVIDVVLRARLSGIIATNTTTSEVIKSKYGEKWRNVPGAIGGNDPDFRKLATDKVSYIYKATKGNRQGPIIIFGSGGVHDTQSALEKIRAGARGVQVVTGIRSEGPRVASNINRGISAELRRDGIDHLEKIVGSDHQNLAA